VVRVFPRRRKKNKERKRDRETEKKRERGKEIKKEMGFEHMTFKSWPSENSFLCQSNK